MYVNVLVCQVISIIYFVTDTVPLKIINQRINKYMILQPVTLFENEMRTPYLQKKQKTVKHEACSIFNKSGTNCYLVTCIFGTFNVPGMILFLWNGKL